MLWAGCQNLSIKEIVIVIYSVLFISGMSDVGGGIHKFPD